LLDDAIREHLELRRRRGADPGLVAREEHDAFGPIHALADPHAAGGDIVDAPDPHSVDPHSVDPEGHEDLLAGGPADLEDASDMNAGNEVDADNEADAGNEVDMGSPADSVDTHYVDGRPIGAVDAHVGDPGDAMTPHPHPHSHLHPHLSHVGQETAELDMRAVLGDVGSDEADHRPPPGDAGLEEPSWGESGLEL